jgi:hypothetical protein
MVSFIARRRFFTISCIRAFASGGKYFSTYFFPTGLSEETVRGLAQRFQRGLICCWPARYAPLNAKFSSTKGFESEGEAASSSCHSRYVFQSFTGTLESCRSTSTRNFGSATFTSPG